MLSIFSDRVEVASRNAASTEYAQAWPMPRTGIFIVGHGSRERASNLEFEELVGRIRTRRPEFDVRHGYIELATPSLADGLGTIVRCNDRVVVIPCFLFSAGHVKNDIASALASARRKFPAVRFEAGRALGVHRSMAELAFQRASEACGALSDVKQTVVVVVGRGSSDPDANGDFCKLVRLFGEGRGFVWVVPTFIGITRPLFGETIELVARVRPERILVVPYFLFGGRLVARLEEQVGEFANRYPWIAVKLASHLGVHPTLLEVIDGRISEALSGEAPLPCDNCQYRVPPSAIHA